MKLTAQILAILSYLAISFLTGCRQAAYSPRLEEIDRIIAESPDSALSELGRISPDSLSEHDHNLYDLLSIKAADKMYIRHTSDSLILQVLNFYDRHKDDPHYPEALYYGGRVYSDIGDLPTSLKYFQAALDKLPADTENQSLRNNVLSQTGRLLNSLRLHREAIPYLKEVIKYEQENSDSLNLLYDLELLGQIAMHDKQFAMSDSLFRKAMLLSQTVKPKYFLREKMFLAALKNYEGKTDSALILIRNIPENISSKFTATALSYAADIYKMAGKTDSAYMYASRFIKHQDAYNLRVGYSILLSDSVRDLIPRDSIDDYIYRYRALTERFMEVNGERATLIQNSLYNYNLHERERSRAERSRYHMAIALGIISVALTVFIIVSLSLKLRNNRQKNRLYSALEKLNALKTRLDGIHTENVQIAEKKNNSLSVNPSASDSDKSGIDGNKSVESIVKPYQTFRDKKRKYFLSMSSLNATENQISEEILKSDGYRSIVERIGAKTSLNYCDKIWDNIEIAVLNASPDFKQILTALADTKLKNEEYHTLLLLKCGLNPTDIASLQAISKGGLSSRRRRLCVKIFGTSLPNEQFDKIICLV